jgi:hypothetical protein
MNSPYEGCVDVSCTELTQPNARNNSINGENILSSGVNTVSYVQGTLSMEIATEFYRSNKSFLFLVLVRLGPLGTAATTDLLYQPQVIDVGVWSN